ncbi:hypothetical protein GCM10009098_19090 [Rheinheimera aquimaris]|uniref:Transposase n=1 Tax=Rheinheimera aquimaris TaxID=412437 RepID=A0ABP3NSV6_9GAMM
MGLHYEPVKETVDKTAVIYQWWRFGYRYGDNAIYSVLSGRSANQPGENAAIG